MSSALSRINLNERQSEFVRRYVKTGEAGESALAAGYSSPNDGYRLLRHPQAVSAIRAEVQRSLAAEAAPAAFKTLQILMADASTGPRIRADIGVQLMKMAGHVVPTSSSGTPEKQIHEMTRDEMVAYIERNQAAIDQAVERLSDMATPLNAQDNAPKQGGAASKPLDYLD